MKVFTFSFKDNRFALDVESGSVHVLSDLAFDAIQAIQNDDLLALNKTYKDTDVAEILEEIETLKKVGLLFSEREHEPDDIKAFEPVVKALCLNITTGCNLRCSYCFAGAGHVPHENMSFDVAKQAIDFLVANSRDRFNLEVDFFGGEPTINFDVIKQTVDYARGLEKAYHKNFRFTVTTNAYHLTDEMIAYFNTEMKNVVLSMDGRKEIHDSIRKTAGDGPSFDAVYKNAKKLVDARGDQEYYVRGTYTKKNLDFSKDVINMYDLGFKEVSVEPVVTSGDIALDESDLPQIFAEYEKLTDYLIENRKKNGLNFFHFMIDLSGGPCLNKRLRGCGAGVEYFAVNPDGNIYPCHQFAGDKDFIMGNVAKGDIDLGLQEGFKNCHVYTKPECTICEVKYYCSGGCMANAYHAHGDINKPYELECEMMKKRVALGIALNILEDEDA
jgi:uncharacterized protein